MDLISSLLSAILFAVFVPGVIGRIPAGGSPAVILVTHAILFSLTVTAVMTIYWSYREKFGNYGAKCPNGFRMTEDQNCVPTGHATYDPMSLKEKDD
jgi:hypothetical protein